MVIDNATVKNDIGVEVVKQTHLIKGAVLIRLNKEGNLYKSRVKEGKKSPYFLAGNKGRAFYNTEDYGFDQLKYTIGHSDIESIFVIQNSKLKEISKDKFFELYGTSNL